MSERDGSVQASLNSSAADTAPSWGLLVRAVMICLSFTQAGCGREAFLVTPATEQQQAPGTFVIPPKVDILLAEDDTGSFIEPYQEMNSQLPGFLNGLEHSSWDYHFATTPLTTDRAMTQALASHYDSGWGASWIKPFPGAIPNFATDLASSVFTLPENYSGFVGPANENLGLNGKEFAFENIRRALGFRVGGTGFLRSDALLVIVAMSNGNDNSLVNICTRSDGVQLPCEDAGQPLCTGPLDSSQGLPCGTKQASFDFYEGQFAQIKGSTGLMQFHSIVASLRTSDCRGGTSYVGDRYQKMSSAFGGKSYDICTQSISDVLGSLAASLHGTRLGFRTRYLFIDKMPDVATIRVTKYPKGNTAAGISLSHSAVNGWTYAGNVTNVFTIDYPVPMNKASGFAIELHGSAKLVGDDTAAVNFKPAGARDSITQ